MGRDLTLYPIRATKNDLKEFIESMGFVPCKHLWNWPKGTLNYSWFEDRDYLSIDGVSADIFPIKTEEKEKSETWALHVRNLYSASIYDVEMLNQVLREGRKKFGGSIEGDYGKNRYAPLWKDYSTPLSRGLTLIYEATFQRIKEVEYSIPDSVMKPLIKNQGNDSLIKVLEGFDPTRKLYNALIPFIISSFEFFFSRSFEVLIKYDLGAQKKLEKYNQKVDFKSVLSLIKKTNTIEGIVSDNYSFQRIESINKAYLDWLEIDIKGILSPKKKVGNKIVFLKQKIEEIIKFRHGVIHNFHFDDQINKKELLFLFEAVKKAINETTKSLEKKYKIKISS